MSEITGAEAKTLLTPRKHDSPHSHVCRINRNSKVRGLKLHGTHSGLPHLLLKVRLHQQICIFCCVGGPAWSGTGTKLARVVF